MKPKSLPGTTSGATLIRKAEAGARRRILEFGRRFDELEGTSKAIDRLCFELFSDIDVVVSA
jgi:hypothetical protein